MKYGYIRVSTERQNTARQREAMDRAGILKDNVYEEKKSGRDLEREELQRLLKVVRSGDSITVVEISRLGRNTRDIVNVVYDLNNKGIKLISIKEGIDTSTEMGKVFVTLAGIFAELERDNIRERARQGIEIAKREGRIIGRPKKKCEDFARVYGQYRDNKISLEQALKLLGCSKSTMYRRIRQYEDSKFIADGGNGLEIELITDNEGGDEIIDFGDTQKINVNKNI